MWHLGHVFNLGQVSSNMTWHLKGFQTALRPPFKVQYLKTCGQLCQKDVQSRHLQIRLYRRYSTGDSRLNLCRSANSSVLTDFNTAGKIILSVRFQVPMTASTKMSAFRAMALCSLIETDWSFRDARRQSFSFQT